MKIVTASEMRQVESKAGKSGVLAEELMRNAGKAVAQQMKHIMGGVVGKRILVLVGPGNNGGDGLFTASLLRQEGAEVWAYLCASRSVDDPGPREAMCQGVLVFASADDRDWSQMARLFTECDSVLDAVFGTGQNRQIDGVYRLALLSITKHKGLRPSMSVFALDIPSGLSPDNGQADLSCPQADYTITLGCPKRGLFTENGVKHAGKVVTVDIGIPIEAIKDLSCEELGELWARATLPSRFPFANKGSFGKVLALAGSKEYVGAACLCCGGALRAGAGRVTLAGLRSVQSVLAGINPEVTYLSLQETVGGLFIPENYKTLLDVASGYDVFLVGCGLGPTEEAKTLALKTVFRLSQECKLVVDADALNYLSSVPKWWMRIPQDAVLTPHVGEMARLCGISIDEVKKDCFELLRKKAAEWNKTIVLKDAISLIASPRGEVRVNNCPNAGMASAGTGDVLAGVIAGLAAQGLALFNAACLGVYLHSCAGSAVRLKMGDMGMLASDVVAELPYAIKRLKDN